MPNVQENRTRDCAFHQLCKNSQGFPPPLMSPHLKFWREILEICLSESRDEIDEEKKKIMNERNGLAPQISESRDEIDEK